MRLILVVLEVKNSTQENCSFEVLLHLAVVVLGQQNTLLIPGNLFTWPETIFSLSWKDTPCQ